MAEGKTRKFDLGKDGSINCYVSENEKRLLITFEVDEKGLTKTGVNGLIECLLLVADAHAAETEEPAAFQAASVPREADDYLHDDERHDGDLKSHQPIVARHVEHELQRLLDAAQLVLEG